MSPVSPARQQNAWMSRVCTRCDLQRQQLDKEAEFLCRVGVLGWWFSWGGVLAAAKWKVSLAVFGVLEMADGGLRMSLKHSVRLASRS